MSRAKGTRQRNVDGQAVVKGPDLLAGYRAAVRNAAMGMLGLMRAVQSEQVLFATPAAKDVASRVPPILFAAIGAPDDPASPGAKLVRGAFEIGALVPADVPQAWRQAWARNDDQGARI